ncbi:MAG: tRNA lysidine(34) synthetase TilS, partial [Opitutales bacterium]
GSLRVRTWLPGDRYAPLGAPGRRKLQDMFTDRKVPASLRGHLPVILTEPDEIAWCPGLPPAENCRVTSSSQAALRLTYDKPKAL